MTTVSNLFIGGFRVELSLPDSMTLAEYGYEPFFSSAPGPVVDSDAESLKIEIRLGDAPRDWLEHWDAEHVLLDTKSTWAMARTQDSSWPFHLGPSPVRPSDPPVFHLRSNHRFNEAQVYLGAGYREAQLMSGLLYPLDEVLMRHLLATHGGLLVHAAGLEVNGKGYLFLGDSGAGKSTIAGFFEDRLGEGRVFSDDRIILRYLQGKWWVFGSPWHGTLPRALHGGVELGGLCFIEQTTEHKIRELTRTEALAKLVQTYLGVWWLSEYRMPQIETLERFVAENAGRFTSLGFTRDASIVDVFLDHFNEKPRHAD